MPAHSHRNGLKTAALLGLLSALVIGVFSLFGTGWLLLGLVAALGMNGYLLLNSAAIALRSMRARPVSEAEQPQLYRIVREISVAARQPMPRLYVSPTMAPNAFATGRNPRGAAVCATTGLLAMLDERELRAVLGHELAHVYNRDILISSVAAALASVVMVLAQFAWLLPLGEDDEDGGNLVGALLLMVLGPVAASVMQLALSRSREFQADASGAALTGDPMALANALRKVAAGTEALPLPPEPNLRTTSALMIANPFRGGGMNRLFATHPPMSERVARLERLAGHSR